VTRAAAAFCLLFLAVGCYQLDQPGIQADEALFTMGIFYPRGVAYSAWVFGHKVPLMQMSYLGSLKAWLWAPVFALAAPSAWTLRLPALLAGAATLWLLYRLLSQAVSPRAGLVAVALLALEPTFLWTTRCDWGPVALQHFLIVAGVYAAFKRRIGLAAFLAGLALWDKTVAVWMLTGLVAAALLLFAREVRQALPPRALLLALLAFLAGAYPLIRFNLVTAGRTAQQTARFSLAELPVKVDQLNYSLRGDSLVGYLIPDDGGAGPRRTVMPWLLAASALLAWRARSRAAWFFLLAPALAWVFMAITHEAGKSAHHVVLLWPWPHAFAAVALTSAFRQRAVVYLITAVVVVSCAIVNWHFFRLLSEKGTFPPWSNAIYPLARYLTETKPAKVFVNDWGILDQVRLLSAGRLAVDNSLDLPAERYAAEPGAVFVEHVDEWEAIKGTNARMRNLAGYRQLTLAIVADSRQRPIFRVYRFQPAP
jgi:4-amino-4-deoxy-L-arabinose transferase-like glycosyltransferase